jgi:lipoyl synthase
LPIVPASLSDNRTRGDAEDLRSAPKPSWLKVRLPAHPAYFQVSEIVRRSDLHTICQSARCPNVGSCWAARTATFLILGDICTRRCAFCAVKKGAPVAARRDEPGQVAEAVAALGLKYAVITSVTRDDLPDGGASAFARTIDAIRVRNPAVRIEVLVPDFQGDRKALAEVIGARPDVLNHNLETTETRYPLINRPPENYRRSLKLLGAAKRMGVTTKSGLMVGLGEGEDEIIRTLADLRDADCDLLTLGQYLRPSRDNAPVSRYVPPEEFEIMKGRALAFGFKGVEAGPLVRSSYRAHEMWMALPRGAA